MGRLGGLFGRDLDDDAYAMYQGGENEEGEKSSLMVYYSINYISTFV